MGFGGPYGPKIKMHRSMLLVGATALNIPWPITLNHTVPNRASQGVFVCCIFQMLFAGLVPNPALANEILADPANETFKPWVDDLRKMNEKIHHDERVHVSLLTTGDGTSLVFKK